MSRAFSEPGDRVQNQRIDRRVAPRPIGHIPDRVQARRGRRAEKTRAGVEIGVVEFVLIVRSGADGNGVQAGAQAAWHRGLVGVVRTDLPLRAIGLHGEEKFRLCTRALIEDDLVAGGREIEASLEGIEILSRVFEANDGSLRDDGGRDVLEDSLAGAQRTVVENAIVGDENFGSGRRPPSRRTTIEEPEGESLWTPIIARSPAARSLLGGGGWVIVPMSAGVRGASANPLAPKLSLIHI